MINTALMDEKKSFFSALLLFIFLFAILYSFMQYSINPDGISYITIARKYASGNFSDAVNAYWGPLYSILLVPFLLTGLPELLGARLLQLLLSIFLFFLMQKALRLPQLNIGNKGFLYLAFIPVSLYFVYWFITPDLLLALIVFWYTILVLDPEYENKASAGIYCGLLGGLAFLAKSYGLFYFLIHFTIINFLYLIGSGNKKKIFANYLTGAAICIVIAAAWGGILTTKYGSFTLGTGAETNLALVGPKAEFKHLHLRQRILVPPNETAISAWEDPSAYPVEVKWNPLGSREEFEYQISLIINNSVEFFSFIFLFSPLVIFLIALMVKDVLKSETLRYLIISGLVYPSGYLILFIETRYIWLTYLIVFILTFSLFSLFTKRYLFKGFMLNAAVLLLMLSLLAFPAYALFKKADAGKNVYALAQELKKFNVSGNFACSTNGLDTHYLAYFLDSKYYGEINKDLNDPVFFNYLKEKEIDYFFLWDDRWNFKGGTFKFGLNDMDSLVVVKIR